MSSRYGNKVEILRPWGRNEQDQEKLQQEQQSKPRLDFKDPPSANLKVTVVAADQDSATLHLEKLKINPQNPASVALVPPTQQPLLHCPEQVTDLWVRSQYEQSARPGYRIKRGWPTKEYVPGRAPDRRVRLNHNPNHGLLHQ